MKRIAFILITFLFLISLTTTVQAVVRDWAREDVCDKNSCSLTLYGSVRFVPEGKHWIPIEEADHLEQFDRFKVNYLSDDKIHGLEIVKFNYSCVTLIPYAQDVFSYQYGENIPLKVDGITKGTVNIPNLMSPSITVDLCFDEGMNVFNHEISFGEKSTTIILDGDSGWLLEDTYSYEGNPSSNYGSGPPTFDNMANQTHTVNTSFSYDLDASDTESSIDSFWLNDTSIFIINISTGVITNTTSLSNISIYWLNVSVNDTEGNVAWGVFFINVTAPSLEAKGRIIMLPINELIYVLMRFQPPLSKNADMPGNSIYYSTDNNKLVYKDSDSNVHELY